LHVIGQKIIFHQGRLEGARRNKSFYFNCQPSSFHLIVLKLMNSFVDISATS
jgi:hypothetical protein